MNPNSISFSVEVKHGRKVHIIKQDGRTIWTGSVTKFQPQKIELLWEIVCKQADTIAQLQEKISKLEDPNLVLLEPVD